MFRILPLILLSCVLTSCSRGPQRPDGMPNLYPVKITILQENRNLEGASVILLRQDGPTKWVAGGRTDINGSCDIRTQSFFRGAPAGIYKVMISKELEEGGDDPNNAAPDPSGTRKPGDFFDLVDLKFKSDRTTDLEAVVKEKKNSFTFDVGKPIKMKVVRKAM